jgi:hypothetical protein
MARQIVITVNLLEDLHEPSLMMSLDNGFDIINNKGNILVKRV